jgi:hypothetical protein
MNQRRARRQVFRDYLKRNNVPKPLFKKISEKLLFNRLNHMTFLEDLRASLEAAKKEEPNE